MQTTKIAQLFNEYDQVWYDVYRAPGIEAKWVTVEVPRDIREPHALRKLLLRGGANLPILDLCKHELENAINFDAEIKHRAAQTGWRDDGGSFVTHLDVIGEGHNDTLPPPSSILRTAGDLAVHGDLKSWKQLISVAEHSTVMLVALSATFSAAFLSLLERPSFALVLVGRSRGGKTTAQLVVASVIGWGKEEHLPTLTVTPAGLLDAGLIFNDSMLPINEMGTARGAKCEKHKVISEATYALMTGRDVLRHHTYAGSGPSSSFKVLPIFSSEISPDEWAARGAEARDDGETVRMISLPAIRDGDESIFDLPPPAEADTAAWASAQFETLRQGLPLQRGVAWRAFLKAIIAKRDDVLKRFKEDMATFHAALGNAAKTPIQRDIAAKFAFVHAGGMAAADVGVLPFDEETILRANLRGCRRALKSLPDRTVELRADVEVLLKKLAGGGIIDKKNASETMKKSMLKADGFFEETERGRLYVVRGSSFLHWFRSETRASRLLDWLAEQGVLRHVKERHSRSNAWAWKQVTWPDESRPRCFCIYIAEGADLLEILG